MEFTIFIIIPLVDCKIVAHFTCKEKNCCVSSVYGEVFFALWRKSGTGTDRCSIR